MKPSASAGERFLLLKVGCRERSDHNNISDLTIEVRSTSGGIHSKVVHDTVQKMTGLSRKLGYGFQFEEEGRWDGIFHTRVVVQERSCAMTIDHMTLINAASIEMVEKLEIPITLRAQPYSFLWVMKSSLSRTSPRYRFCWENIFVRFYAT